MSLNRALDLSLYLSKETEIMPVTQGLSELVPLYKLMEKREDLEDLENQMKVCGPLFTQIYITSVLLLPLEFIFILSALECS